MTQLPIPPIIEQVSQPFAAPVSIVTMPAAVQAPQATWLPAIFCAIWAIGFVTPLSSWWMQWRSFRAVLRTAAPLDFNIGMDVIARRVD